MEELLLYKQVSHKSVLFTECVHVCFKLFSLSLGQLISDRVTEIVAKYDSKVYSTRYDDQLATRPASAAFDDSYLGMWFEREVNLVVLNKQNKHKSSCAIHILPIKM